MRVLFINSVCGIRSTGRICASLAEEYIANGYECRIAYGRIGKIPPKYDDISVRIGSSWDMRLHGVLTRMFDLHGFGSYSATKKFLKWATEFDPDIVWLHNIHGYYINVDLLFRWIKSRPNMMVKWTLHDCWAFTGHCAYFTENSCNGWREGCKECRFHSSYPSTWFRNGSQRNFQRKMKAFSGVKNMEIVVPSNWLASLVKESALREYPVRVQHNQIDTTVFYRRQNTIKERFSIEGKQILLGVASTWSKRKGFEEMLKLAAIIPENWVIVLVGVSTKQKVNLPPNVIGLEKTSNQDMLAEIYSAADVFFNPTFDDNYPTVNLEAEACGTRVITYDVGGCSETISRLDSVSIPVGQYERVLDLIIG